MLHAHFTAVCVIDAELLVMEFSLCEDADLSCDAGFRCECTRWSWTFYFCDLGLDLDLMTFIYKHVPYSVEIHRMCKYELHMSRLSKVIV